MAKIKLGAFVTEIAGKVGGSVFSRNRGGAYVKNRTVPTNPNTVKQQQRRATFGLISQAWRGLTEGQRNGWNSGTDRYPIVDQFGDTRTLSGAQLFQKLNANLSLINEPLNTTISAPQGSGSSAFTDFQVVGLNYNLKLTEPLVNAKVVISATPPQSAGVRNLENKLRCVGVYDVLGEDGLIEFGADYIAAFGRAPLTSRVGVSVKVISTRTGECSAVSSDSVIV